VRIWRDATEEKKVKSVQTFIFSAPTLPNNAKLLQKSSSSVKLNFHTLIVT